ncbi:MAG: hypothetical protein LLG00_00670, partial [Planctomycetaceae bacterium]|nr:hypothetical protein [Planctomycetaceae bacterium]
DATFYQSVKGMVGALGVVKQGGTIVLAASLSEGIGGPEFQRLFRDYPTIDAFMATLLEPWGGKCPWQQPAGETPSRVRVKNASQPLCVVDQWQLEELAKVWRCAKIKVVSDGLPPEKLRSLFVEPVSTVETAVADALAEHGPDARIAVIPAGPYVLVELATPSTR